MKVRIAGSGAVSSQSRKEHEPQGIRSNTKAFSFAGFLRGPSCPARLKFCKQAHCRIVLGLATLGFLLTAVLTMPVAGTAAGKDKEAAPKTVDSGTLGVFMGGRRMATETFSIEEGSSGSVATSQFKTDEGPSQASQSSELQLTAAGELRKYEWKEQSPGKAQAVVTPNDSFLTERSSASPQEKPEDHPFLLPPSTNILDDYAFIHREILVWKYLATACRQGKGALECPTKQPTQFGTLNPHARAPMLVTLTYRGKEKVLIRGAERELNSFALKSDTSDWGLWFDDQFKIVRILIPGDNTEVIRD